MSALITKTTMSVLAGVAGTLFVGYCIYFDRQRRSDPQYRKKLREKRKNRNNAAGGSGSKTVLPDMKDPEAVQQFFLREVPIHLCD